jgi:hypothetical protein
MSWIGLDGGHDADVAEYEHVQLAAHAPIDAAVGRVDVLQ